VFCGYNENNKILWSKNSAPTGDSSGNYKHMLNSYRLNSNLNVWFLKISVDLKSNGKSSNQ